MRELRGLPRHRLRDLEPALRLVALAAGDVVCEEGEPADRIVAVASGELDGEVRTTRGGRYSGTVRAVTPARLWTLPAADARAALDDSAESGTPGLRIDVRRIDQRAGRRQTLHGVSLTAEPGELLAIVGASGSGKTTLLDAVSGVRLDPATAADLMRLLRRLAGAGATVVLTTHNPPDVALCDKVAWLALTSSPA
ncbi:MAG: transporter related [Actinoallomurus sp.]|nr:transporter related [Actinoallomurus sp.]